MRKIGLSILSLAVFAFVVLFSSSCAKKVTPPPMAKVEPAKPAPPPPPPTPTIALSTSPSLINRGQTTTLTWKAENASSVTLDGGIGTVPASGARTVNPQNSTTYTAVATGAGGRSEASTRVTVQEVAATPPKPPAVSDAEFFQKRVQDIFFDYDKYDIRGDQQLVADSNSRALAERSNIRFTIEGHCDERGSEKYNLALGDRRANAVKAYLVDHGVASDRISAVSYGKERPFDPGHNEAAWAKNRRAHFVLKQQSYP